MDEAIFKLFSNGYKTGRDAYVYNFSRDACTKNARKMVDDYLGAWRELDEFKNGSPSDEIIHEITGRHSSNLRWDGKLKNQRWATNDRGVFRHIHSKSGLSTFREAISLCSIRPFLNVRHLQDDIFPAVRQRKPCDLRSGNRIDQAILGARGRYDAGSPTF